MAGHGTHIENQDCSHEAASFDRNKKGAEHEMQREVASSTPNTPEARAAMFKPSDDTASRYLHKFEITDDHGHSQQQAQNSDAQKNAEASKQFTTTKHGTDGSSSETTKNQYGETIHNKQINADKSSTELTVAPDQTVTSTETSPNGDYVKHVISGTDSSMSTTTHKKNDDNGYTDTVRNADGTTNVHLQKGNGDFVDSKYDKDNKLESQTTRIVNGDGSYREQTRDRDGKTEIKSYDSDGKNVPNKPAETTPTQAGAVDVNKVSEEMKAGASALRNEGNAVSLFKSLTLEAAKASPAIAGVAKLGGQLSGIGRAAQVGSVALGQGAEEGGKEAIAVGAGWAARVAVGAAVAAPTIGADAPVAFGAGQAAGMATEACVRDALHHENCAVKAAAAVGEKVEDTKKSIRDSIADTVNGAVDSVVDGVTTKARNAIYGMFMPSSEF